MACMSSVTFEVLVNGGKSDQFKPSRGLRQGNPLSPYLFILGREVLSRRLDRELAAGNISGAKTSVRSPALTHVMYANNIVLFSKATSHNARILSYCLDMYCAWSGQCINRNKSGIFFSKHSTTSIRRAIKQNLQMKKLKKTPYTWVLLSSCLNPLLKTSNSLKKNWKLNWQVGEVDAFPRQSDVLS